MFFNRCKKRRPYMGLAMFTLAAAGMISVATRAKDFMMDKAMCLCHIFKKGKMD